MVINDLLLVLQKGESVKYQCFSTILKKFEINLGGGKFPVLPSFYAYDCMMIIPHYYGGELLC